MCVCVHFLVCVCEYLYSYVVTCLCVWMHAATQWAHCCISVYLGSRGCMSGQHLHVCTCKRPLCKYLSEHLACANIIILNDPVLLRKCVSTDCNTCNRPGQSVFLYVWLCVWDPEVGGGVEMLTETSSWSLDRPNRSIAKEKGHTLSPV